MRYPQFIIFFPFFILFNFFLDEKLFRLHCKRVVDKFTNNVIEAAQRELTVETAMQIRSLSTNALNLIKPETIKFLSKTNALIDKNFTIPETLPIENNTIQNTPTVDEFEKNCKKNIAELEMVYKQQAIMMNHLLKEKELYDTKLMEQALIDQNMCDLYDNNFSESNFNAEMVDNVASILKDIGIQPTDK